jgi:hypothetical protein
MQTKEQIKNEGFEIKKSSAAAFFLISLITSACGQKADPYQACLTQKMTELKQSESHKGADNTSLAASAKKACLAAMPTVKEPTITGY